MILSPIGLLQAYGFLFYLLSLYRNDDTKKLQDRCTTLESYDNDLKKRFPDGLAFGWTTDGKLGYKKDGADTVTPFSSKGVFAKGSTIKVIVKVEMYGVNSNDSKDNNIKSLGGLNYTFTFNGNDNNSFSSGTGKFGWRYLNGPWNRLEAYISSVTISIS